MGEMADYYREQEEVYGFALQVTRLSKDLQTEHLQNILNMHAQGKLQMPDAWVITLEREMARR